ncbi:sulfatase [Brevifollis gellanilyticus]|uniref:sulfatase n=1 Tax=Brevifollis gellanilyticus TaxID=748831 RepID=UPI0014787A5D|nr:sulfatase [Brevifollis gellanilyticus]
MPSPRRLLILVLLALLPALLQAAPKSAKTSKKRTPSAAGKPNVLFIIADDLRDYVGWMGGHPQARTPNMDRLAKMGMRFTNAHCNYALCNPSRTSLLTGMMPSSSGVFGNEQDWRRSVQITGKPTLPEHFKSLGFHTAAGGKIFHANHGGPEGRLSGWHGGRRGFEQDAAWDTRFPDAGVQIPDLPVHTGQNFNGMNIWHWDWGQIDVPDELTDDGSVVAWASDQLGKSSKQPFFLAVGLYRPHSPWYVPKAYFDLFPIDSIQLPEVKADDLADVPEIAKGHEKPGGHHDEIVKQGKWKEAVRAYLASVAFCDAMLGKVLDALEAGPNAKNTIIVFTSDHGWYLGEKQMWHKGKLWEETTRIPLCIVAPGITQPDTVSAEPVSLIDLYPTLCDLTQTKAPEHLDGTSLVPMLKDPATKSARPAITIMGGGKQAGYAARTDQWRYIRYADGSEELYDHQTDPHEWTNVANDPANALLKQDIAAFFPTEFRSASRPVAEILPETSSDGSIHLSLVPGDALDAKASPPLTGRGFFIDTSFDYHPLVDQDSTLVFQGDAKLGYALHLVAGQPTLSVFHDGKVTTVSGDGLQPGTCHVRAGMDADGLMSLAIPGRSEMLANAPFATGFPGQPATGLAAGRSFGPLSVKDYPNSTPFDGTVHRLRITLLPPREQVAKPAPDPQ